MAMGGLGSGRRQQRERHEVPRAAVDAAVGEDLAVFGELELALHQPVGELAGLDREWVDVASHLFVGLAQAPAEDDLEHPRARAIEWTKQQRDQMRVDRDRNRRRRRHREHRASDVDAC